MVRPVQPAKAWMAIEVTEAGIWTVVRPVQSLKACSGIVV